MVSIADGLANRYQGTAPEVGSSRGSAMMLSERIEAGTTLALFAGTRFWAISCSAVSSRDDGTTRKAGRMLSTVLPSSPGLLRHLRSRLAEIRSEEHTSELQS